MDDKHIDYKTALLLKQTGFSLNVRGWYPPNSDELQEDWTAGQNYHLNNGIAAPTQTFVARWLREVHNLEVNALSDSSDTTKSQYWVLVGPLFSDETLVDPNPIFKTYEEALESGLQEALKLVLK